MQAELDEEAARAEQADRELNELEREGLADGASPEVRPDDEAQGPGALRSISMLQKCRDVQVFEKIRRISEGTYGVVYQCAPDFYAGHAPVSTVAGFLLLQAQLMVDSSVCLETT